MKKRVIALTMVFSILSSLPAFAGYSTGSLEELAAFKKTYTKEANPLKSDKSLYPLSGEVEYGRITKEMIDISIANGELLIGTKKDGSWYSSEKDMNEVYKELVGTAVLPDRIIDSAINTELSDLDSIRLYLAGLYEGELSDRNKEVIPIVKEYLNSYDWKNASEYERVVKTKEFIADRAEYNPDAEGFRAGKIYGCLVDGEAACEGFASSFYLLARCTGLNVVKVDSRSHSWNYVEVDGVWHNIDFIDSKNAFYDNYKDTVSEEDLRNSFPNNQYVSVGPRWEFK